MAYSNVLKPSFYIDNFLYKKTIGYERSHFDNNFAYNTHEYVYTPWDKKEMFTLNPTLSKDLFGGSIDFVYGGDARLALVHVPAFGGIDFDYSGGNMQTYVAVLNHNLHDLDKQAICLPRYAQQQYTDGDDFFTVDWNFGDAVNWEVNNWVMPNNGSSIITCDTAPDFDTNAIELHFLSILPEPEFHWKVGAISVGIRYTMPHSPDLKLDMEIEFDGYKETTTSGGSSITNINYTGSPLWNNGLNYTNPFEIYPEDVAVHDVRNTGAIRNGRKSWKLSFTLMDDKDIFPSNAISSIYTETTTDYDSSDLDYNNNRDLNMAVDDSFISQVWNKTLGGALPFIFQPDSTNYNPDEFYLCKFDKKSLKIKQDAYKTYSFSVDIKQVW